jgi:tetratricopeptide (TPR) repeat protein
MFKPPRKTTGKKHPAPRPASSLENLAGPGWLGLAILAAFAYLAAVVEPRLLLFTQQTGFFATRLFLRAYLTYPGGLAEYAADFLAQFFESNLLGAALLTSLLAALAALLHLLIQLCAQGRSLPRAAFATVLAFGLLLVSNYYCPLAVFLKLGFSLLCAWLYLRFCLPHPIARLAVLPLLPAAHYTAGGLAMLLLGGLAGLGLLKHRKERTAIASLAAIVLLTPAIPGWVFSTTGLNSKDAWLGLLTSQMVFPIPAPWLIYSFFGACFLLPAGLAACATSHPPATQPPKPAWWQAAAVWLLIPVLPSIALSQFDWPQKYRTLVSYYAEQRQWSKLLECVPRTGAYDQLVCCQRTRALFFTGRMLEDLLDYPQAAGASALIPDQVFAYALPISDLYYDLGYVSEALRWAYEVNTIFPNSPAILKRIAQCYLAIGNYPLAEKYLRALDDNWRCRGWVRAARADMSAPPSATLQQLRKRIPRPGLVLDSPEPRLRALLDSAPDNRMAREYDLAFALLNRRLDTLPVKLEQAFSPGAPFPKLVQQALLATWGKSGKFDDPQWQAQISPQAMEEYNRFVTTLRQHGIQNAQPLLAQTAANTYWYYDVYVGAKTEAGASAGRGAP